MAENERRDARLDAAIEGAADPVNFNTAHHEPAEAQANAQRGGGGSGPASGTSQGAGTSTAGPSESPEGPQQETGGPRGSGYPPSRTSGGRLREDDPAIGVEPDEAIKRDTAVFEPGTGGRKPRGA
jgi:hypothetical protein